MNDMLSTIIPKSDQANYDDFIGGVSKTIKITKVSIAAGDQPVSIHYEGDQGKPYKACKSMRRVLVHCWGPDANTYVGRSLTLYGDPEVVFGGAKVGGIRISHMSHIEKPMVMALTSTRANKKPFTVRPFVKPSLEKHIEDISLAVNAEALKSLFEDACADFKDESCRKEIIEAKNKRKGELV